MSANPAPLVQWSFLQFKKQQGGSKTKEDLPPQCYLSSATQIGKKFLIYGGCDGSEAKSGLFLYDTMTYKWSSPNQSTDFQEDSPGQRYGHTATLVEMHPPKILIYGGVTESGTFEFSADLDSMMDTSIDQEESSMMTTMERTIMGSFGTGKKQGKQGNKLEEKDENVYMLTLNTDKWIWSKPLVHGGKSDQPKPRTQHSCCKTSSNEVTIFGGLGSEPLNDVWSFNFVDMEWRVIETTGPLPQARYGHTAEVVGTKMFILGGTNNEKEANYNCGIHVLCLETMTWSSLIITGIDAFPRFGHGSAMIGAKTIAIFGGKVNSQVFLNDVVLIDLEDLRGTVLNTVETHMPTPITHSSLCTVGNKIFVFGGVDLKGTCYNDIRSLELNYYLSKEDISVAEGATSEYCFKILVIGDAAVGKSCLLTRFSENTFVEGYQSTIGIDFNCRTIKVEGSVCKLEVWDTAGQERFSTITANYYRGAQGALLVYDVGRRESFQHVQSWFDRAKQLGGEDIEPVLVGNKCDLPVGEKEVTAAEAEALAEELGIPYIETSALNGSNVEAAFVTMTSRIKSSVDRRGLTGVKASGMTSVGGVQLASGERQHSTCSSCYQSTPNLGLGL